MPENLAQNFLSVKEIGDQKYWDFVNERLLGEKSIWNTMKKAKLPTFICNNIVKSSCELPILLNLKRRTKAYVKVCHCHCDLPGYFGMEEFAVVPTRSLFTLNENLQECTDKANAADEIYNFQASVMLLM